MKSLPSSVHLALKLVLGWIPLAVFAAWVALNCSLPYLPQKLGWPWLVIEDYRLIGPLAWNVVLLVSAAFLARFPPRRSLDWMRTGVAVFFVMALWQHTGRLIWLTFDQAVINLLVSVLLFVGFLGAAAANTRVEVRTQVLTLCAVLITPVLTLDRLLIFFVLAGILLFRRFRK